MSNDPVDGGTVTYHRARWHPDGTWAIHFTEDGPQRWVSWAEGEAMGLTPPEPAPLVVECNGHRIELSDDEAEAYVELNRACASIGTVSGKLARLLRAARQDPQPASDPERCPECGSGRPHRLAVYDDQGNETGRCTYPWPGHDPVPASADSDPEPWPWGDEGYMCPKMVRETLCVAQAAVGRSPEVDARRVEHVERISRLINLCDRHRPLGPDGKHGTRQCTPTCGCEDKREPTTPVQPASDTEPATCPWCSHGTPCSYGDDHPERFVPQPAPATSDNLDFDALPIGTVLRDKWGDLLLRRAGGWFEGDEDYFLNADDGPYTVVHQPAPLSPGECLRGLLAGPDFERMLREAKGLNPAGRSSWACLMRTVGAAAREVRDV